MAGPIAIPESLNVDQIGAVGHFISAMLQTVGLNGQSAVLTYMSNMISEVGALFYLVAIIGAMMSIAIYGNYKKALYLFIAPGIFFTVLKTTVPATGTLVRFGERTVEDAPQSQEVFLNFFNTTINLGGGAGGDVPQIAWFYVVYDNLVTSVVQGLVAFLVDTENREDLVAAGRERVYSSILNCQSTSPHFLRLIAFGTMGQCARPTVVGDEAGKLDGNNSEAKDIRDKLEAERAQIAGATYVILDPDIVNYIKGVGQSISDDKVRAGVTCSEIWSYITAAARAETKAFEATQRDQAKATNNGDEIPWDQVWKEMMATIVGKNVQNSSELDLTAEQSQKATDVIAAILIRNSMKRNIHSAMVTQIYNHVPFEADTKKAIFSYMADSEGKGMVAKLVYFSGIIPYIQGLLLMILTVIFPFFTVFLLMPGKYQSFFIWMTLWLWVKSWDVGFAIICFLKDFLWQFLSGDIGTATKDLDWNNPSTIFEFIAKEDPIATPFMYSAIISGLTCAVPILTSQLCMGASNLMQLVRLGTDATSNRFGQMHSLGPRRYYADDAEVTKMSQQQFGLMAGADYARLNSGLNGASRMGDARFAEHVQQTANLTKANVLASRAFSRASKALGIFEHRSANPDQAVAIGNPLAMGAMAWDKTQRFYNQSAWTANKFMGDVRPIMKQASEGKAPKKPSEEGGGDY